MDEFRGHTEVYAVTGQTFSGTKLCKNPTAGGRIRIVGKNLQSSYIGRLEIFHRGAWGTIGGRERSFGNVEAKVACSQLGMTGGTTDIK